MYQKGWKHNKATKAEGLGLGPLLAKAPNHGFIVIPFWINNLCPLLPKSQTK